MSIIRNPPKGFSIGWNRGRYTWTCTKCFAGRDRGVVPATVETEIFQHKTECRHPKTWIAPTGAYHRIWRAIEFQRFRRAA